ncbi:4-oxalocrotonate tautomerase family protein [Caenimonas terrae]|uniref:4-oxalocrotonate tautomerase family protein n=1 Tax=Caenimonas terrae TaxID=696074 RepID=A0ABW0N9U4_9BURK
MPTLKIKIAPLQNPERHASLARALTQITARTLGKRPEVTAVVIEDLPDAQWFIGGRRTEQPTALLEIDITHGTNTPPQKEAFIEAAFAELQRQLAGGGALAQASYVIVRELPATDWGYDGVTQWERKRTGPLVAA